LDKGEGQKESRHPSSWIAKKYTDEELLQILRETSEALGGVLTTHAYDEYAEGRTFSDGRPWPSHQTHFHRFGSWRRSLLSAGLAANPSSAISGQRLFDRGQCIDAVRHVGRKLGGKPSLRQYETFARKSNGGLPSAATVRNRCGSWSDALRLAFTR
jgi:Homing endonuclease associated repeat